MRNVGLMEALKRFRSAQMSTEYLRFPFPLPHEEVEGYVVAVYENDNELVVDFNSGQRLHLQTTQHPNIISATLDTQEETGKNLGEYNFSFFMNPVSVTSMRSPAEPQRNPYPLILGGVAIILGLISIGIGLTVIL